MFKKIAETIEMSFDIPEAEKDIAKVSKQHFEATISSLKFAVDHLDHIYNPFKEHSNISVESVVENRGILQGRYSTKIKDNFEKVKKYALVAIRKLNKFTDGDSDIVEIVNTFEEAIGGIEDDVSKFLDILKNEYESEDFRKLVIDIVDNIKSKSDRLEDLVYNRIIDHINVNILTKSWMHDIDVDDNDDDDNIPYIVQLVKEREEKLGNDFPAADKKEQSLNLSDAQRMYYPDHMSNDTNTGNFGE